MSSDHRDGSTDGSVSGNPSEETKGFSSSSIIKLRSIVGSIKTWGEYTRFCFSRYSALVFYKLSHFNSRAFLLDFT